MKNKVLSLFDRYTAWTDSLLVVLTVFTCTFFVYRDFGIRMIVGYAVLCAIFALHLLRRIRFKRVPEFTVLKASYLLMAALIFVTFLFPAARRDSDTVAYMIAMVICFAYLFCTEPTVREIKLCEKIVVLSGLAFAAFIVFFRLFPDLYWGTVYQIISEPSSELAAYYIPRGYGVPIGGSYTFADYVMMLGALFTVSRAISKSASVKSRVYSAVFTGVFLLAVFLVGRRGEFLAMIAVLAVVLFLNVRLRLTKRAWCVVLCSVAGLVLLLILLWPLLTEIPFLYRYIRTFEKLFQGGDITSGRTELWGIAWGLFLKYPVFGHGWGSFANYVSESFRELHGQDVMDVHNTYLQLLCETGIVGTVLILSPIVYILVQTVRQTLRLRKNETPDAALLTMNVASLGMQVFFLALGMLDPCFYKLIYWAFYAIALILLGASLRREGVFVKRFEFRKKK